MRYLYECARRCLRATQSTERPIAFRAVLEGRVPRQSARRLYAVAAMLLGAFIGALLEKHDLGLPLAVAAGTGAASFATYVLSRSR